MPKTHCYGSESKPSNAEPANNDNDGVNASHQKQRVRQYELREAPPIVKAENETELKEKTLELARVMAEAGVPGTYLLLQ